MWDEAEELATNRAEWRQRVAQYIHLDVGWTKVLRLRYKTVWWLLSHRHRTCHRHWTCLIHYSQTQTDNTNLPICSFSNGSSTSLSDANSRKSLHICVTPTDTLPLLSSYLCCHLLSMQQSSFLTIRCKARRTSAAVLNSRHELTAADLMDHDDVVISLSVSQTQTILTADKLDNSSTTSNC